MYSPPSSGSVDLSGYAPLNSPAFTGTPSVPTASLGDVTTRAASTAFVATAIANAASSSPTYTSVTTSGNVSVGGDLTVAGEIHGGGVGVVSYVSSNGFVRQWTGTLGSDSTPVEDIFATSTFSANAGELVLVEVTFAIEINTGTPSFSGSSAHVHPYIKFNGDIISTLPWVYLTDTTPGDSYVIRKIVTAPSTGTHSISLVGAYGELVTGGSYDFGKIIIGTTIRR